MLYFSKFKLITIYIIILILSLFSIANFTDYLKISKKVNLGLDLQGGSYLLLEVDSKPMIKQQLQQKYISIKKFLKENKIKYKNIKLINNSIEFLISEEKKDDFEKLILDKENSVNLYFNKYRSYEMTHSIEGNKVK